MFNGKVLLHRTTFGRQPMDGERSVKIRKMASNGCTQILKDYTNEVKTNT